MLKMKALLGKAAVGGVLEKKVLLKILQNSLESTCVKGHQLLIVFHLHRWSLSLFWLACWFELLSHNNFFTAPIIPNLQQSIVLVNVTCIEIKKVIKNSNSNNKKPPKKRNN